MKQTQTHINLVATRILVFLSLPSSLKAHDDSKPLGLTTVCIDPGHGGKDPGCVNRTLKCQEKDIVLGIGKKLKAKINAAYPDVKVVMTRSTDKFIELAERAAIANRNDANLFISIHVNSLDLKAKGARSVNGFSIHTLGQSSVKNRDLFRANMELCKRENSVIFLEDDYSTTYQGFDPNDPESFIFFNLMQNANLEHSLIFAEDVDVEMAKGPIRTNRGISQNPFLVLWKTKMPSVLVETGFITNESDCRTLDSDKGQDAIAQCLFKAFVKFKKRYDSSLNIKSEEPLVTDYSTIQEVKDASEVHYGIQVLATGKKMQADDKFFRGYENECVVSGKLFKYILCPDPSLEKVGEMHKKVKKWFPDSFIVQIDGTSLERVR